MKFLFSLKVFKFYYEVAKLTLKELNIIVGGNPSQVRISFGKSSHCAFTS